MGLPHHSPRHPGPPTGWQLMENLSCAISIPDSAQYATAPDAECVSRTSALCAMGLANLVREEKAAA